MRGAREKVNTRTGTFLAMCLFQTAMAANLFLVLGLRRNFPQFQGAYANILLVDLYGKGGG